MNKKILGVKIGTILTALACLIVSVVVWMLVKYSLDSVAQEAMSLPLLAAL